MEKALKSFDDIAEFNKNNVDALVQSANAASKGIEAISAEVLSYSKQSVEDAMAATKAAARREHPGQPRLSGKFFFGFKSYGPGRRCPGPFFGRIALNIAPSSYLIS
jgi:hypothetical protein